MTLRRLKWVFWTLTALRWFPVGFMLPVFVLTLETRGLGLGQIGLVFASYSVVTALMELPTGGLADHVGRKPVLLLSGLFELGMVATWLFASTFPLFLTGAALGGLGRALSTGPLEAWYVDSVNRMSPGTPYRAGLAGAGMADALGLAISALAVSAISYIPGLPSDGPLISILRLPPLLAAGFVVLYLVALISLLEEPRHTGWSIGSLGGGVPQTVGRVFRIGISRGPVRLLLIATVLIGAAGATVEMLYQPFLTDMLDSTADAARLFGFLVFGFGLAAGIGSGVASKVPEDGALGPGLLGFVGLAAWAGGLAVFSQSTTVGMAVAAFIVAYALSGFAYPFLQHILHESVSAAERSTMVSAWSLTSQAGVLITGTVMAQWAAAASEAAALAGAAAIASTAAVIILAIHVGHREGLHPGSSADAAPQPGSPVN